MNAITSIRTGHDSYAVLPRDQQAYALEKIAEKARHPNRNRMVWRLIDWLKWRDPEYAEDSK